MSKMHVMSSQGDTVLEWNPTDARSTAEVEAEFNRIVSQGAVAYRPTDKPGRHEQIRSFDPSAETIVVRGPLVGG